jgi:hypothetical protein
LGQLFWTGIIADEIGIGAVDVQRVPSASDYRTVISSTNTCNHFFLRSMLEVNYPMENGMVRNWEVCFQYVCAYMLKCIHTYIHTYICVPSVLSLLLPVGIVSRDAGLDQLQRPVFSNLSLPSGVNLAEWVDFVS